MSGTGLDSTESKLTNLSEKIRELMKEHQVPGVAIGLILGGVEHVEGFGVTSAEHPLPVTPETLFQIGSITKTVTATVLMRLVERNALDLNAPVQRYLPDFRVKDEAVSAQVTVRHLLTHVAGWTGDVFTDTGAGDDAVAAFVARMSEFPQFTAPGELWSYNNSAFILAGRLIEVVAEKPYELAVRELVLEPLGLNESFFFPAEVMVRRFVVGHLLKGGRLVIARPWNIPRNANPAGGLASSVRDQLRYARFHMGDGTAESGERLLSAESMRQMQSPVAQAADGQQMGLGWFIQEEGGIRFLRHGGATFGQMALLWVAPDRKCALSIVTNADRGAALLTAVSAWVREHFLGLVSSTPEPLDMPEEELADYTGTYQQPSGARLVLEAKGNRLTVTFQPADTKVLETKPEVPPPAAAALVSRDRLMLLEGPNKGGRGEFLTTPDGRRWLRFGGRAYLRV